MASKSKIEILLSAKDTGLTAAFTKAKVQMSLFSHTMSTATAPMRSLVSGAISLKSALAGIVAGAGLSALGKSLIDAGKGMDSLKLSFVAIAGSSQGAAHEMEFVRTTANSLGLDLLTAAAAYKQIAAAAMGTSMAGKQTQAIFTAVAKASTTLGLSADETSGALLAISQMISKGKVSAEELRGQLGERLPGAFQIAAQAMGMTTGELDKFMSDGKLMAEDFLPKFAVALEQRFGKSAATAANTFTGASNRIGSALDLLKGALGQAVTNNNFFVTALGNVAVSLGTLGTDVEKNQGKWREWAKQSALSVVDFAASTVTAFDGIYRGMNAVTWIIDKSIGKIYQLKASYIEGAVAGAKFRDEMRQKWLLAPADESGEVAKLTKEFDAARQSAAEFTLSAEKNWQEMDSGSGALQKAAESIKQYREQMSKVESTEVIPSADVTKTSEQIVKIGGVWRNVTKDIKATNAETTKDVNIDWGRVWNDVEKNGVSAADAVDKALDRATRSREAVINVKTVEGRQHGGLIGAVQRFSRGGKLTGYGGGDRISALLEAGEFVIRKEAVSRFGSGLFHALNSMRLPEIPRFAVGGPVGFSSGGAVASGGELGTLNLTFPTGAAVPVQVTRSMARELLRQFEQMGFRATA